MPVQSLFPTLIYAAPFAASGWKALNARLRSECLQLRDDDAAGRAWSKQRYPGGFTSYGSQSRMHTMSPTFAALERGIDRHVARYARSLELDLEGRQLSMTDCWVNIMPRGVAHGLHLHPLSTISGTYYVQVPRGSPGLKFEDPRLDRFMASPPRKGDCRSSNRPWVTVEARAGRLVMFESWLRHEVLPNGVDAERISISFNYNWF